MKNLILLVFTLSCLIFSSCQQASDHTDKPVDAKMEFDESQEKEAIMEVIEGETQCFFSRDYDCWKRHWVNEDYAFQAWSNSDGTYSAKVGWEAVDSGIGNYIKENPVEEGGMSHPIVKRKGLQVKFYGKNLAYLIWEQYNSDKEKKTYKKSQEVRLMEKVNGEWKIVNVSAFWDHKNEITIDSLDI